MMNYPAFPSNGNHGLTRREYIATACLQGMLANSNEWEPESAVRMALRYADELIKEEDKYLTQ